MKEFRVDENGTCSEFVEYISELPKDKTPVNCFNARILEEEIIVRRQDGSISQDYGIGRLVCPLYAIKNGGIMVRCQGVKNLKLTPDKKFLEGYCEIAGEMHSINIK